MKAAARKLLQCHWFDADWYRWRYPDVPSDGLEAAAHFFVHGADEGRDPGPDFSTTGYRYRYPQLWPLPRQPETANPVLHHAALGRYLGRRPLPRLAGWLRWRWRRPAVLVCGHQAEATLYGAERSLLDLLDALAGLAVNVVVALPAAGNAHYVEAVRARCAALEILPYPWWHAEREPSPAVEAHFVDLIRRRRVALVHANTLALDEPLRAAQSCGIPRVTHVRELPGHDHALRAALGASATTILRRAHESATRLVANSACVANALNDEAVIRELPRPPTPVHVIPNAMLPGSLETCAPPGRRADGLRVGMISSNLPKKGLEDMGRLADVLARRLPEARCLLFGPPTEALQTLLEERRQRGAADNLMVGGYVAEPAEALAQLDVLVNLSHFQESFGRTVLEAMWAARPVVVYDWGALPELVQPEKTGYVVERGDVEGVADHLVLLAQDRGKLAAMGAAAREHARQAFHLSGMIRDLKQLYSGMQIQC